MNNKIISNNNINYFELIVFIKKNSKAILKFGLFGIFLYSSYFLFIKTPSFTGKVAFYTDYNEQPSSSFLDFLPSGISDGSESLYFSVSDYVNSDNFLESILSETYLIDGKNIILFEHIGKNHNKIFNINPFYLLENINYKIMMNPYLTTQQKKMEYSKKVIRKKITHSENRKTNLHSINITITGNPDLAQQIIENIYSSVISFSNQITSVKANEKRIFIEERLKVLELSLVGSENDLIAFLEKNKNYLNSPQLVVEKQRIDREIFSYNQIFVNLNDQLELAKIDQKDNTSSIFLLENPNVSSIKSGRSFFNGNFQVFIIFTALSLISIFFRRRNEIF